MTASRDLAILLLSGALSGCGTIATAFCDSCGKLAPYSGTRMMATGHSTQIDVPFSLVLDTVLLPLTIPKTIVENIAGLDNEPEVQAVTAPTEPTPPTTQSVAIARLAPPSGAYVMAPLAPAARATTDGRVVVYLMPLDDFPIEDAQRMARVLADELHLNVKASPPMAPIATTASRGRAQYSADEVLAETRRAGQRLPDASDNVVLIALTQRDINDSVPGLNFVFSKHDLRHHASAISMSRLGQGTEEGQDRLYKMTKRTIGEQYFGMKRSTDRRDVMFAPILSLRDLDTMGRDFLQDTAR